MEQKCDKCSTTKHLSEYPRFRGIGLVTQQEVPFHDFEFPGRTCLKCCGKRKPITYSNKFINCDELICIKCKQQKHLSCYYKSEKMAYWNSQWVKIKSPFSVCKECCKH